MMAGFRKVYNTKIIITTFGSSYNVDDKITCEL
jgi:hypothetical protein